MPNLRLIILLENDISATNITPFKKLNHTTK